MQSVYNEYGDSALTVVHRDVDIALPISISPNVELGDIKIMCCGEPRVECCKDDEGCSGISLKITQTVTYKIPIEYQAEATAGTATSECKKPTTVKNSPVSKSTNQCTY